MQFRQTRPADLDPLCAFYQYVCEKTDNMPRYCRWIFGLHPSEELLREFLEAEAMYLCEDGGEIVAAAAMTMAQDEDYHDIAWAYPHEDDAVAVIHVFCVRPELRHTGLAQEFAAALIRTASEAGKKSVRLDALASNLPTHRFYARLGFVKRGVKEMYACNVGQTEFWFFERELDECAKKHFIRLYEFEFYPRSQSSYYEFYRGKWDEEKLLFRSPESIYIHDDYMYTLELDGLIHSIIPDYDSFGETEVTKTQWEQIVNAAQEIGGEVLDAVLEAVPWAEANFKEYDVFTILGI